MLTAENIEDLARKLQDGEQKRVPQRQFSIEYPEITIEDAYAIQRAWIAAQARRRANAQGPQDRADVARDAALVEHHRARLRRAARRHVLRQRRRRADRRASSCRASRSSWRSSSKTAHRARVHDLRRAGRDGLRGARDRDHRRAHPADRSGDQGDAQGLRHDLRQRGRCRRRVGGPAGQTADAVDLRWVAALLYRNGVIEESGVAAAVLNHPANGIAWLANKLHPHGEGLAAGEIVLAGSFTRSVPVRHGEIYHCDYGSLGTITCRFA